MSLQITVMLTYIQRVFGTNRIVCGYPTIHKVETPKTPLRILSFKIMWGKVCWCSGCPYANVRQQGILGHINSPLREGNVRFTGAFFCNFVEFMRMPCFQFLKYKVNKTSAGAEGCLFLTNR